MTEEHKTDALDSQPDEQEMTVDTPVIDDTVEEPAVAQTADDDVTNEQFEEQLSSVPVEDTNIETDDQVDDSGDETENPETSETETVEENIEQQTTDAEVVEESHAIDEEDESTIEPLQESYFVDDVEVTVLSVIESILFASDETLTPNRIVSILEAGSVKQVRECIEKLNDKYEEEGSAFRIERIAGGYQMMTLNAYNHWLKKLVRVRTDSKLSQAALETLAIISYKQPIIRADVEAIRGVSSGEMIRSLMYKGLVKIIGRAEILGRPMLYGTTKKFLDSFGLNSLKDLPKIEELKRPKD